MWLVDSIVSSMALAQKAAVAMAAAPLHSGGRPAVAGAPVPVLVPRCSQRSHVTRAGVQPVQAVASPPAKPATLLEVISSSRCSCGKSNDQEIS